MKTNKEDWLPKEGFEEEGCLTCRFYGGGVEDGEGFCFRYPPFPSWLEKEREYVYLQPVVGEGTWCGEYKALQVVA